MLNTVLKISTGRDCLLLLILFFTQTICLFPKTPAPVDKKVVPIVTVPFEFYGNLILFKARINASEPLVFVLDTGTKGCVLYKHASETVSPGFKPSKPHLVANDSALIGISSGNELSIQTLKLDAGKIKVLSADRISGIIGKKIDGVIGSVLFEKFIVEINFEKERLLIYDRTDFEYQGKGKPYKITLSKGIPKTKIKLKDPGMVTLELTVALSTGFSDGLVIQKKLAAKTGLFDHFGSDYYYYFHPFLNGHTLPVRRVSPYEVVFFGKKLKSPSLLLARDKKGNRGNGLETSMAGNEFLKRFHLVFDYAGKTVYLKKNNKYKSPFPMDKSGLVLKLEGESKKIIVKRVKKGSPAAESGIQAGDEIISIYNDPVSFYSLEDLRNMLSGTPRKVEIHYRREKMIYRVIFKLKELI